MIFLEDKRTSSPPIGLLLANTGTPDSPTPEAVRRYLKEFLSDQKVVRLPHWLWLPVLNGVILYLRPRRSARLYARIWTEDGSPYLKTIQAQAAAVAESLAARLAAPLKIAIGMRYGEPSIAAGLRDLRQQGAERFLILPLFPQYSGPTSESILEAAFAEFKRWGRSYPVSAIPYYYDHPAYIRALASSIREHWDQHGNPERLLLSYHGIPLSYSRAGDPYAEQCSQTSSRLASNLGLDSSIWRTAFQSRFGPQAWLQPYTDRVLRQWAKEGIKRVDVICPGFAADCLETLHEIDHEMRGIFEAPGKREFHYIPALNDRPDHIHALVEVVLAQIEAWLSDGEDQGRLVESHQMLTSQEISQDTYN